MDRSKTVTDAKAAFLRSQIRLLSAVLQPSSQWREFADDTEDNLPDKVVQDAMNKGTLPTSRHVRESVHIHTNANAPAVNEKVKQHNRSVYSAPSQRHVAEQVDALYWQAVSSDGASAEVDSDTVVVSKDADLSNSETVSSLPRSYDDLHLLPQPSSADSSSRYDNLRARLTALTARRDAQTQKLARYKQLQGLLEPFANAQENVQPNLVTRDGELGKELEKMRMLLVRVTGRIEEMKEKDERGRDGIAQTDKGMTASSDRVKLAEVMDLT